MNPTKDWRAICRQHAYEQATAEALAFWECASDSEIPFNYRWEHVQEVVRLAVWLCEEIGADMQVVEAAAWLHDVRKTKSSHARAGAKAARAILSETDFPLDQIETVADAISQHAGLYRKGDAPPLEPLEAGILWDADKLSKLGVQALTFFLCAPHDRGASLSERRVRISKLVTDVLSRTVSSMNTAPAQRLAARRYQDMMTVLESWAREEREIL